MTMLGLAIPYGVETVIGEWVDGEKSIYREQFTQQSWAELPKRVPFLRSHQRQASPLGWVQVDNRPGGLHVLIEPIAGSTAANDAVAEVRSGVLSGLSVGFWPAPELDQIDAKDRRRLPLVRRRGAMLREVSLALEPAYPGAEITSVDADLDAHNESERLLEPARRAMEVTQQERRQSDAELLRWLDELDQPPKASREPEPTVGPLLARIAGETFAVVDGADPAWATDRYLSEVVQSITRAGRALHFDELAELQTRCGLAPVAR